MPTFNIPSLYQDVYIDGSSILPGDSVVPVIMVVDANNKIAFSKGSPISVADINPPVVAGFAVSQGASDYVFTPNAGSIMDYNAGTINVYHVIADSSKTAAQLLALVQDGGNAGKFGSSTKSDHTQGVAFDIADLSGLATGYGYFGSSFRQIAEGDTVYNHVLAVDPAALKTSSSLNTGAVDDKTAPTGLDSVTLGTSTNNLIPVENRNNAVSTYLSI